MADSSKKFNLADLALGLLFTALLAALVVQIFIPNPLRQAVLDEAERPFVEIVLRSDAMFLADRMTPGDQQVGENDVVQAELLSVTPKTDHLLTAWKVRSREWRDWVQFGTYVLRPGEKVEIFTREYKLIGWLVEVRGEPGS